MLDIKPTIYTNCY